MITDRIGRPEVLLPTIKNMTLSEDLRKDKEIVEKFAKPITGKSYTVDSYNYINTKCSTLWAMVDILLLHTTLFLAVVFVNF